MTLRISKVFTYDEDAGNYIQAVEGASGDNQALEPAVRQAINNFVIGCKQDGIWNAFEQCAILCGARTRQGAVIPLVKPSGNADPTFNGTVGGWSYNRKTGLAGNGTDNYIDTKYIVPSGNQNNCHLCVWKTSNAGGGANPYWLGTFMSGFTSGFTIGSNAMYPNSGLIALNDSVPSGTGLHAWSRSASNSVLYKRPSYSVSSASATSANPPVVSAFIFNTNINGIAGSTQWSSAPLGFYSIGKSIDINTLNARVTDLINALAAAIP